MEAILMKGKERCRQFSNVQQKRKEREHKS
jgi:hypothetical protein